MTTANVAPLQNIYYFKCLKEQMEVNDTNMIIDGAGILWHINDLERILQVDTVANIPA